jgi:hypothetical protein
MAHYIATLKIGNSYHCFGRTFLGGTPSDKPITAAEKEYLEQTAIHVNKTTDGKRLPEPMFTFEEVKSEPRARAPRVAAS